MNMPLPADTRERLGADTRLECRICWYVYDPAQGQWRQLWVSPGMRPIAQLADRYRQIARARMAGLPIYNARLEVEPVGFRDVEGHRLGVLVTPWFMNLILLPATDQWDALSPGSVIDFPLPAGEQALTVCRDDQLGTYLSAVLFRSMTDFPDQRTTRAVARAVLEALFEPERATAAKAVSRRHLLAGMGAL